MKLSILVLGLSACLLGHHLGTKLVEGLGGLVTVLGALTYFDFVEE